VERPHVPIQVRLRLGDDASAALAEMIDTTVRAAIDEAVDRAVDRATDRFERRLAEELGKLRIEVHTGLAALRVELLKWSFLFWTGQIIAIAGLLAVMR